MLNFLIPLAFLGKLIPFIHGQTNMPLPCVCSNCSDWILSTTVDPTTMDPRFRPTLANGHVGTIISNPDMHINGFFHGRLTNSTRIKVPNWMNIYTTFQGTQKTFSLNLQTGMFQTFVTDSNAGINVTTSMYAHAVDKHYLITEVLVERTTQTANSEIRLPIIVNASTDLSSMNVTYNSNDATNSYYLFQAVPSVLETTNVTTPNITIISTIVPTNLTLLAGETRQKWIFFSVIVINNFSLALIEYNIGVQNLSQENNGMTGFMSIHTNAWSNNMLYAGVIEGNCDLAAKMHAAYYYLLGSLPVEYTDIELTYDHDNWPFYGISPGSLASEDEYNYHGHVFWDQDLWMMLAVIPAFHGTVKKVLLDTRVRNLDKAKLNAQRYGLDGARYPWELAYSGYEVSSSKPLADLSVHVTGDSALLARTYLRLSGDTDFAQQYYNTSIEIAKYFYSLLQPTSNNQVGILNVMGPDEYHFPVNNSVYTNSIAKIALELPNYIYTNFNVSGDRPQQNWTDIASRILILLDTTLNYHPQYDGYMYGERIRQADVVLLGYPLLVDVDPQIRENDLLIYQAATDPNGPAMSCSMYSIGWLEVGEETFAASQFKRNFDYIRSPFNIWTSTAMGTGTINFVTGMGGFIQNIIVGYLGLRIHSNRLEFTPYLPPDTTRYTTYGVHYQSLIFVFVVDSANVNVSLLNGTTIQPGCVFIDENGVQTNLTTAGPIYTGAIKKKRTITCQPNTITMNNAGTVLRMVDHGVILIAMLFCYIVNVLVKRF